EPEQKELLQDAAVLGRTFWSGWLAGALGLDRIAVEERLHELERGGFVRRERRSAVAKETQYAFLHVLGRDVAYAQLPAAARAEPRCIGAPLRGSSPSGVPRTLPRCSPTTTCARSRWRPRRASKARTSPDRRGERCATPATAPPRSTRWKRPSGSTTPRSS